MSAAIVKELWRIDELHKLEQQYASAQDVLGKIHKDIIGASERLAAIVSLIRDPKVDPDVVVVLGVEMSEAREKVDNLNRQAQKQHEKIEELRARIARWKNLRRWAKV